MNILALNRLVKSGFKNFFRNIGVSLSATSIMCITLFIISTVLVLYTLTDLSLSNARDRVGVTVYFSDTTSEKDIMSLRDELAAVPEVKTVTFTSKVQARDKYILRNQNRPKALEALKQLDKDTDPFPNSFAITANNLTDYEKIVNILKSDRFKPYLATDGIRDNRKIIDRLQAITAAVKQFGILLTIVFIVVTIMVMFNTIRLAIYNRREEIEIMRLVGATNWFIRGPFLVEGLMYALLATAVTSLLVFGLLTLASARIESFLDLSNFGGSLIKGLFLDLFMINLATSIALGFISSTIAIRRYLRI